MITKKTKQKVVKNGFNEVLESFYLAKVQLLDIRDGEKMIILLNPKQATAFGINIHDRVSLIRENDEKLVVEVGFSAAVAEWHVALFADVTEQVAFKNNEIIAIKLAESSSIANNAIRKKMKGDAISYDEMFAIIKDISENKLDEIMMTYYVASSFFYPTTDLEMYQTAKAMAENGEMFRYPEGEIVADKHCIGGVPGNETTMILIPLIASLGIKIPKNFSKSITSPAATGECVNVLMDISFNRTEIEQLVQDLNCCLVRWGGLALAPADDKLIKVQYPLSMQSRAKVVSSIMAKKYAMGITHLLIDVPVGPTAKVTTMEEAKDWKKKFEYVGKKLWILTKVAITPANEVIWNGVGAKLQVREVLRVLQQHPLRPKDLEEKTLLLAQDLIEMVGLAKGKVAYKLAKEQLTSGKARAKMQEIIQVQRGNPEITSEALELWKATQEMLAEKDGKVTAINLHDVNLISRKLGCPIIDEAGMYLHKKIGDPVKKGEPLCTLYADDETKLGFGVERFKEGSPFEY